MCYNLIMIKSTFYLIVFVFTFFSFVIFQSKMTVSANSLPVNTITQYMNGYQISNNKTLTKNPISVRSSAGYISYDKGWAIYNNSVNDGNEDDIEFTLEQNFPTTNTQKRYCITLRDLMPFGVSAKLQIWTGEYTITSGYPVGLETNPQNFLPTTPISKQMSKVCSSWSTILNPPSGTPYVYKRLAIVGGIVVKQGAVQIQSVSIESK